MEYQNQSPNKTISLIKNSVSLKLFSITLLALLLLIPTGMIKSIIKEREQLGLETINTVSDKWAENQTINGPILTIPLNYEFETEDKVFTETRLLHLLPETLNIKGNVNPENLEKGIYEVVVYKSKLNVSGNFNLQTEIDQEGLKSIRWDQAFLSIGLSDSRGIKDNIQVSWNGEKLTANPGTKMDGLTHSGVNVSLPNLSEFEEKSIPFNFALDLQGSKNLTFIPVGSTTDISLTSSWSTPAFEGNFIPNDRNITETGFTAKWKILQLNRDFPDHWINNEYNDKLSGSGFGVELLVPLDDYQKAMRSVKYALMTISLTFLVFFLVEVLTKQKIHPFQYVLVGLSLCLFYVLLISISEVSNFNFAYLISAAGIITMISLYSLSVFEQKKSCGILFLILIGIYGFLYVTLQMTDYALLLGSIGLTLIMAVTMYFTRKVNWYEVQEKSKLAIDTDQ